DYFIVKVTSYTLFQSNHIFSLEPYMNIPSLHSFPTRRSSDLHVAGMHLTTPRGPFLHPNNTRIAAKRCHYNTGGYMTLAELGMAFWHDLAAPVIAGILASMIVNWLNKRK